MWYPHTKIHGFSTIPTVVGCLGFLNHQQSEKNRTHLQELTLERDLFCLFFEGPFGELPNDILCPARKKHYVTKRVEKIYHQPKPRLAMLFSPLIFCRVFFVGKPWSLRNPILQFEVVEVQGWDMQNPTVWDQGCVLLPPFLSSFEF